MITGDFERIAVRHLARNARKAIPDRLALAILEGGALDLRRGRRDAPHKISGEMEMGRRAHQLKRKILYPVRAFSPVAPVSGWRNAGQRPAPLPAAAPAGGMLSSEL